MIAHLHVLLPSRDLRPTFVCLPPCVCVCCVRVSICLPVFCLSVCLLSPRLCIIKCRLHLGFARGGGTFTRGQTANKYEARRERESFYLWKSLLLSVMPLDFVLFFSFFSFWNVYGVVLSWELYPRRDKHRWKGREEDPQKTEPWFSHSLRNSSRSLSSTKLDEIHYIKGLFRRERSWLEGILVSCFIINQSLFSFLFTLLILFLSW